MKTVGILGGMGPLATADFMEQLIRLTPAKLDQEHIPTIVHNVPQIPNRIESILNGGESPLPFFINAIENMQKCGVEVVVIPCNTAHYWYDEINKKTSVEMIHIVDAVSAEITAKNKPVGTKVGILATEATVISEIYQKKLNENGYFCVLPDVDFQKHSDDAINLIKAGELQISKALLEKATEHLLENGAEIVVLGCTELPIVLDNEKIYIDSNEALAKAVIELTFNKP